MKQIKIRNQQRRFSIAPREIRKATILLMDELLEVNAYDLAIIFVNETRMAKINLKFLHHEGATDIITFDYSTSPLIHGELIICPTIANANAVHYRATLGREIARNIIHGVLHLLGYDDRQTITRKIMKHEENRLLRKINRRFTLNTLAHG